MSCAIAGSDVAITVESMFSMNKAQATMSGIRIVRGKKIARGRTCKRTGTAPVPG
jgi:hypothetical protein